MPVSVHELATTEQFLPVLDGHETEFPAGERFAYNNGGYVVLALLAERASGVAFHELVRTLVCDPAGMVDTAFLRSDELPGRAALGYLSVDGLRTNVFHLPVLGNGDGGHLLDRCRPQRLLGRTLRRADRLAGTGRRDGAPAQRLADRRPGATASGSISTPRATESGSRGTTRACRSPACTGPRRRSPTPSSRTGRMVPGRSSDCSTTGQGGKRERAGSPKTKKTATLRVTAFRHAAQVSG